ncbi:hypothetical protein KSP39_PZI021973 [Platanthera zijinensis]|uniref:Uncharacterized protein n=1 Tax=Platanthera zijinensis TaxID=2320716 RepID=A0AAP0FWV2_9ASPA
MHLSFFMALAKRFLRQPCIQNLRLVFHQQLQAGEAIQYFLYTLSIEDGLGHISQTERQEDEQKERKAWWKIRGSANFPTSQQGKGQPRAQTIPAQRRSGERSQL